MNLRRALMTAAFALTLAACQSDGDKVANAFEAVEADETIDCSYIDEPTIGLKGGRSASHCARALVTILDELGFDRDVVVARIEKTSASDGEQTATSLDDAFVAFWTFHPDDGLEVIFGES